MTFEAEYQAGPGAIDEFFFPSHTIAQQSLAHTDPQWTHDPGEHIWSRVIDNVAVIDRGEF